MPFILIPALLLRAAEPVLIEEALNLPPPAKLWLAPGESFVWPQIPSPASMTDAFWKNTEGQWNPLADSAPMPAATVPAEGASLGSEDFTRFSLPSGQLVEATVAWLVRAQSAEKPLPSFIATSKTTMRTQIRLMLDPTAFDLGTDVFIKLYIDGAAVQGDFTVTPPRGAVRFLQTGPGGIGVFQLNEAGKYAIRFQRQVGPVLKTSTLWFEAKNWGFAR